MRTLTIPYLNHVYDQLDEQSKPMLRGMGKCADRRGGDTRPGGLSPDSDAGGEDGTVNRKPMSQTCSYQKVQPFRTQQ